MWANLDGMDASHTSLSVFELPSASMRHTSMDTSVRMGSLDAQGSFDAEGVGQELLELMSEWGPITAVEGDSSSGDDDDDDDSSDEIEIDYGGSYEMDLEPQPRPSTPCDIKAHATAWLPLHRMR